MVTTSVFHTLCVSCRQRIEPLTLAETLEAPSRADTWLCRRCYGIELDYIDNRDYNRDQ